MKTQNAFSASIAILAVMGLTACRTQQTQKVSSARFNPPVADRVSVEGYKRWTKATSQPKPIRMESWLSCAGVSADPDDSKNPHNGRFINIFVNDFAKEALFHQKHPNFPVGSVIVKEKLTDSRSNLPVLLTVMTKRETGFNPDSGDWEYLVYDGDGKKIQLQGKLQVCQSCHAKWKKQDFVSRDYLPRRWGEG